MATWCLRIRDRGPARRPDHPAVPAALRRLGAVLRLRDLLRRPRPLRRCRPAHRPARRHPPPADVLGEGPPQMPLAGDQQQAMGGGFSGSAPDDADVGTCVIEPADDGGREPFECRACSRRWRPLRTGPSADRVAVERSMSPADSKRWACSSRKLPPRPILDRPAGRQNIEFGEDLVDLRAITLRVGFGGEEDATMSSSEAGRTRHAHRVGLHRGSPVIVGVGTRDSESPCAAPGGCSYGIRVPSLGSIVALLDEPISQRETDLLPTPRR